MKAVMTREWVTVKKNGFVETGVVTIVPVTETALRVGTKEVLYQQCRTPGIRSDGDTADIEKFTRGTERRFDDNDISAHQLTDVVDLLRPNSRWPKRVGAERNDQTADLLFNLLSACID